MAGKFCDNPRCHRNELKCSDPNVFMLEEREGKRYEIRRYLYTQHPRPGELGAQYTSQKDARFHLCDTCHNAVLIVMGQ